MSLSNAADGFMVDTSTNILTRNPSKTLQQKIMTMKGNDNIDQKLDEVTTTTSTSDLSSDSSNNNINNMFDSISSLNIKPDAMIVDNDKSRNEVVKIMAEHAMKKLQDSSSNQIYIGIAGAPGSGKSTIAENIVKYINQQQNDNNYSVVLPMDGYHLSQDTLKEMGKLNKLIGDPDGTSGQTTTYDDLMRRRGAPWTFNPKQLYEDLLICKQQHYGTFPLYDRTVSDPVPDQIQVTKNHKIIFCEGNYLLAKDDPMWLPIINEIWDDTWLIYVPVSILKERIVNRHLQTWTKQKQDRFGIGRKGAEYKAESSDLLNAKWVYKQSSYYANVIVQNY